MSNSSSFYDAALELLIQYRRLVFSVVFIFIFIGIFALGSMARQEDPSFPYRIGLVTVLYPGASPAQIEKLITEPLEEEFAQVSELGIVDSTSRDDLAVFELELEDHVYDTDAAWDRVQDAIDRARLAFPEGVGPIEIDDRRIDMPAAVLSITGSDDVLLLDDAALKLKRALLGLNGISRIKIEGAPEKEVIVSLDQDMVNRLGISRQEIADLIRQRNLIVPGGVVSTDNKNLRLNTQSDYGSLDELRRTVLTLPSGQKVSLQSIANVSLQPRMPLANQAFQDGKRAVSLGVIAQRGQVDLVEFGKELRARVAAFAPTLAPLKIEESFFQADYVESRLIGLQSNLIVTMLIIAMVVFLAVGWRTGLLVSAVLPIVSMITLGLYSVGGGVFHQMAVIGILISLGILIDNAIVIMEHIETQLRKGIELGQAIRSSIRVLAKPLLASTGTTIAAFIPLLMAEGGVGDFTRAIPVMVIVAMIVSYFVSVFVLPLIAFYWLKPRTQQSNFLFEAADSIAKQSGDLVTAAPRRVLLAVLVLLAFSVMLFPLLKQAFFPLTDRAQIVIGLELPNNTPLAVTSNFSADIEQQLKAHESVETLYRYVGGAGFRFYYNMGGAPNESHIARFTVNTKSRKDNLKLVDWVREELAPNHPDATFIPKVLGQGPPRPAPIEILVKHSDLSVLHHTSQKVKSILMDVQGVTELRSNLDLGTPELRLDIQDSLVLSYGLQPNQVSAAIFSQSRGLNAGQFRYEMDPVPIRVRSSEGQHSGVDAVTNQLIYNQLQNGTPLNQLAAMQAVWTPTTLRHHNYDRTVVILSQIKDGFAFNQILGDFKKKLADIQLPAGVKIEYGGDADASSTANKSIASAAPLAIGMLMFFMMFQFNSFRRIGIVFVSIPLAAVGVIPGLWLTGQPFGFLTLLGVIALTGIVVNNAIVLIDVVDQSLKKGNEIDAAIRTALEKRTAPILLTTATTILGLLPLALSSSTLWPPMAWAIISGLALSTMLTLFAIPALCVLLLGKKQDLVAPIRMNTKAVAPLLAIALLYFIPSAKNEVAAEETMFEVSKSQILEAVSNNPNVVSQFSQAQATGYLHQSKLREAWFPKFTIGGQYTKRDEASLLSLPQPIGQLNVADDSAYVIEAKITQPLFNLPAQRYELKTAALQKQAANLNAEASLHRAAGLALKQYYDLLAVNEVNRSLQQLERSLESRLDRVSKRVEAGNALKTDQLLVQVSLNRVKQQLVENSASYSNLQVALRNSLALESNQKMKLLSPDFNRDTYLIVDDQTIGCFSRKDCLVLELEVESSKLQSKSIKASYLPNVNLSVAETRSDGQLFVSERDQLMMLEFSWPLFLGGQRNSQIKAAKAQTNAVEQQLLAFQQSIALELNQARTSLANAESQLSLAQSSVELDTERLRISRARYENGLLNIDELLDAEASLAQSSSDLARAKLRRLSAFSQLSMATGAPY